MERPLKAKGEWTSRVCLLLKDFSMAMQGLCDIIPHQIEYYIGKFLSFMDPTDRMARLSETENIEQNYLDISTSILLLFFFFPCWDVFLPFLQVLLVITILSCLAAEGERVQEYTAQACQKRPNFTYGLQNQ